MNTKECVVYLGPFSFPNGGAAARRILGISKTLQLLDKKVIVGSGQQAEENKAVFTYEGIEVHSLNERTAEKYPTLIKHLLYFSMGKKTIKWLDTLPEKPSTIILYSGYSPYFLRLLPWCKKNKVKLIFDAVEWYDPPSLLKGIINPYYWNIEFAMRYLSIKSENIIAISQYLQSYYESKHCNVIRIPPTLDVINTAYRIDVQSTSIITLGYTGSPGKKDLLDNMLEAILTIGDKNKSFIFNIAGITEKELLSYPALKKRNCVDLPDCFKCFGVVSQAEAQNIIRQADFSVLLRPNKRYAKAGFPTKFVESLSVGTPVIANHTSDLADYLVDKKNGMVCDNELPSSLIAVLNNLLLLNESELEKMRIAARKVAEDHFDIQKQKTSLGSFIT
jgi:glycosyltransferase involved in cell wall biosynthesis